MPAVGITAVLPVPGQLPFIGSVNGLMRVTPQDTLLPAHPSLPLDRVQCLAQDPERAGIWIGYESQGLFFFDPSPDRVGPLGPLGGLPAGRVNAVFGLTRWVLRRRFRRRLEREKAVHQERGRIARDIHDDLGAGLTHLAMVARIAERDVTQQAPPEVLAGHLQEVLTEAGAMVRSVDEIVWAVTPANDQLAALADYIVQYAQHFLRGKAVAAYFKIAPKGRGESGIEDSRSWIVDCGSVLARLSRSR